MPHPSTPGTVLRRSLEIDSELGPALVDTPLDLVAHADLVGPRPRPLRRPLRGRVDPELAPDELPRRRVVEVVERPLGELEVAGGVDVRADVEEDLLVV